MIRNRLSPLALLGVLAAILAPAARSHAQQTRADRAPPTAGAADECRRQTRDVLTHSS